MDYEEIDEKLPKKHWLSQDEIEESLGRELSEKMKESQFLVGVTAKKDGKGGYLTSREDIIHACLDVTNKDYNPPDWD